MSMRRSRGASDRGAVAILVAVLVPVLILLTAVAVDIGRWYVEAARVQKAADAAALGGVTYMPNNYDASSPNAQTTAGDVSSDNGYTASTAAACALATKASGTKCIDHLQDRRAEPTRRHGLEHHQQRLREHLREPDHHDRPHGGCRLPGAGHHGQPVQHLRQRAQQHVRNRGPGRHEHPRRLDPGRIRHLPVPHAQLLGNGRGAADRQGPGRPVLDTRLQHLDRWLCEWRDNDEYDPNGYFFLVRVGETAKLKPITVQLFDPAFIFTGTTCGSLPSSATINISNRSRSSNVATITTSSNHGLSVGDGVLVAGVGGGYDGSVTVTSTPSGSQFRYANAGADQSNGAAPGGSTIAKVYNGMNPYVPSDATTRYAQSGTSGLLHG